MFGKIFDKMFAKEMEREEFIGYCKIPIAFLTVILCATALFTDRISFTGAVVVIFLFVYLVYMFAFPVVKFRFDGEKAKDWEFNGLWKRKKK